MSNEKYMKKYKEFVRKEREFTLELRNTVRNLDDLLGKLSLLEDELNDVLYTQIPTSDPIAYINKLYETRDKIIHIMKAYDSEINDDLIRQIDDYVRAANKLIEEGYELENDVDDYDMRTTIDSLVKSLENKRNAMLKIQDKNRRISSYLNGDLYVEYINLQRMHEFVRSSSATTMRRDDAKRILGKFYNALDEVKNCQDELRWYDENYNVYDNVVEDVESLKNYGPGGNQHIINRLEWWRNMLENDDRFIRRVNDTIEKMNNARDILNYSRMIFEAMKEELAMDHNPVIDKFVNLSDNNLRAVEDCIQKLEEYRNEYEDSKVNAIRWIDEELSMLRNER